MVRVFDHGARFRVFLQAGASEQNYFETAPHLPEQIVEAFAGK
jgi:hypothetical protein